MFQHTAARRRLPFALLDLQAKANVSTHSRTKAAASRPTKPLKSKFGFNTQPHEGGCLWLVKTVGVPQKFQHTAARRRLRA